jgi:arylsulfatase A-like enzyme
MSNNDYLHRPWHLPEACHVTNWATREMVRLIKRRDPTRPAFWYLSYTPPHPPLVPLAGYLDLYRQLAAEPALAADWSAVPERLPHALRLVRDFYPALTPAALAEARRAFMALCTHIDHQLRLVWGTLREEGLLDDTVVCVTADHGDMLGDFGLYAKRLFYEGSAQVPMLLVGTAGDRRVTAGAVDDRLVGLVDVMPTLLELAGVPAPAGLEGRSMVTGERRATLYGEIGETASATRMLHDGRYKLIWYPAGNRLQLLDLALDPRELVDLAGHPAYAAVRRGLEDRLAAELYGVDVEAGWTRDGRLSGFDPGPFAPRVDRSLTGQRGLHYPQPPQLAADRMVGFPG